MKLSANHSLGKLTNRINLDLIVLGNAIVESGWHGNVISPLFSRLYYITKGSFTINGNDGKSYTLESGKWHLIPAGYSFSYECQKTMEHFYFHVKICDIDGVDLLRKCKEPMSIESDDFDKDFFSPVFLKVVLSTE